VMQTSVDNRRPLSRHEAQGDRDAIGWSGCSLARVGGVDTAMTANACTTWHIAGWVRRAACLWRWCGQGVTLSWCQLSERGGGMRCAGRNHHRGGQWRPCVLGRATWVGRGEAEVVGVHRRTRWSGRELVVTPLSSGVSGAPRRQRTTEWSGGGRRAGLRVVEEEKDFEIWLILFQSTQNGN
jgi:hypothetical protein